MEQDCAMLDIYKEKGNKDIFGAHLHISLRQCSNHIGLHMITVAAYSPKEVLFHSAIAMVPYGNV